MKLIDVPVYNPDGSVKFTAVVQPQEVQVLLQFALNFLTSVGISASELANLKNEDEEVDWPQDDTPRSYS